MEATEAQSADYKDYRPMTTRRYAPDHAIP